MQLSSRAEISAYCKCCGTLQVAGRCCKADAAKWGLSFSCTVQHWSSIQTSTVAGYICICPLVLLKMLTFDSTALEIGFLDRIHTSKFRFLQQTSTTEFRAEDFIIRCSAEKQALSEFCSHLHEMIELCFMTAFTSAMTLYIFTFYKSISEQFLPPLLQSSLSVHP